MEEQILKIIENPQNCPEMSAREIAETFERFLKWILNNADIGYDNGIYFWMNEDNTFTSKDLFNYWKNEVDKLK